MLDRWIHHALSNRGTLALGNDVCCCKTISATFSTTFWQQVFVCFRNKLGLVYHAASNHITACIEFDMMWHIVKQFLKASDGITRLFFMIFFNLIHIFLSFSELSYLCAILLELIYKICVQDILCTNTCFSIVDRKPTHLHKQCDCTS